MRRFFMLEIDLSNKKYKKVDVTEYFDNWLGGTGVATKLLSECSNSEISPYSSKAPIIFAIGPLNNLFPVITKTVCLFKSPLTNDLGESHAGGRLALAMYEAGFHAVKITGKSEKPTLLEIENDIVRFHQAFSLKGMSALATHRVIRDRIDSIGKRSIIRIGPAGERLSPIACATVDSSRHFGRLGLGGVMGSKNLKAVVISGNKYWSIENKGKYTRLYNKLYKDVVGSDAMTKYHDLGTSMNVIPLNNINGLPTRNFSQGYFEGAKIISGESFANNNLAQQIACAGCQIGCIHMATYREPFDEEHNMYKTTKVSYDYELIYALGTNLSIDSKVMILKLLQFIEKQGWDAISMGVTLSWATDSFQKGIITQKQTNGLIINYGDGEVYLDVLKNIATGANEFYEDLEKGSYFCSKKYGNPEDSIVFGKNEAPGYVTGVNAFLGFATGVRHSHLDSAGYSIDQNLLKDSIERKTQVENLYNEALWRMIFNSLVGCLFARKIYTRETVIEALEVIGLKGWNDDKLEHLSHRIHGLKYKFKIDNGFKFGEIQLPKKLLDVYTSNGKIDKSDFERGIDQYSEYIKNDIEYASNN
ncbi:MAG: aldehyde:ferredoxin oxidoreductase [Kosmotoga sp.]|nr:MAG: aldehyde:ferredoxin oxidoreductase [Kosmotoga sp.]